ncbi:CDP-diacylglycerol---serine O-phosphatidyltransferase [Streptoalloteichus tenebrarius]|uniref:CDP-diacylglycerol---serine O-phosphatidyltransferase n=1 Tax=Streptoalloteichus tenebrarius (strain ATCC 17920 / DSM 40477 / JCM 4838 / CBS 697.72 / NBRC 16177 / NCIMB 11028 / NRRL B-12390 / A12253. 1 / ISP 5477) TaxID=1933 RepID=A0ABT1HVA0_STRSD|nr:phosphatidylcholine/phosphatidylserine synthase [Streptoalloteichus tenebrarius]MCP2259458.1 CDP-diacylglycerol---serine O-phosphatidyltransferase [Streptoalloteichus tenebrarius]BFF01466.1 CDP-diacylglycerol--serine O-phosphatidyltransferase [Streptoalloteichus tenebrarius]
MARTAPGVRLLPNAITILALCAGLSAVMFALRGQPNAAIAATAVAALLDGLDGRLARLLDATSKIGAELDSLSDNVSFGVAPALTLYVWGLHDTPNYGWVVALVFAMCMTLRLARFNTLLVDPDQPPFAKEFFVGVPAPAAALLALMPLMAALQFGDGWWSSEPAVAAWMIACAALAISRVPTLSLKTIKVSPKAVAPLLVLVGVLAAAVIVYPLGALIVAMAVYLGHVPYAVYRHRWLARHPEAWDVPPKERRAIRRRHGRRLAVRPALRGRVAAGALRGVRLPRRDQAGRDVREGRRSENQR